MFKGTVKKMYIFTEEEIRLANRGMVIFRDVQLL